MPALAATALIGTSIPVTAHADAASDLDRESKHALAQLVRSNPAAASLSRNAKATLVFPNIVKAGLAFGAAYGEGELIENGKPITYYNSFTGSWGLQAGAQSYGYVVFLMNQKAVDYVHDTSGWEVGVGPTVVVVKSVAAENLSTSTIKDDAYAFIFNQQGLMASVSIEGTKITKVRP